MQPQRRAVMLYMELNTAAKVKLRELDVPGINHNNGLVSTNRIVQAIVYSNQIQILMNSLIFTPYLCFYDALNPKIT